MARHLIKRLVAILMAAVLLASAAVGVSAAYVDLYDYGLAYADNYGTGKTLYYWEGAGYDNSHDVSVLYPYWALDTFDVDYTYTCTFSFNTISDFTVSTSSNQTPAAYFQQTKPTQTVYVTTSKALTDIVVTPLNDDYGTKRVDIIVKFNPGFLGIDYFPLYICCRMPFSVKQNLKTNGWGVSAEYDPGGSQFIEDYLSDIRDQLHAGDDYTPPTSAATDLNNSLTSLDSAEASLSSKAEELRTAGSATMSSAISAAQELPNKIGASTTFLATTFTRFWEAVPEEVTAVLLVCAAILFAGWLIGRIQ